ncbi:hypothetical protein L226DRAFT_495510 [Lentinus tigrinus ALCF2SS1-7]|uniref:uncharacterized protein n=1 Tax=Lentinus tigrinus ALCF2SS1-7 TaxID=1328758 RepID=UPI001165DC21|nr:hypothetical protein L226DRAFT_495510 [Lentinus tigrinus ALCF2SS1-7]
MSFVPGSSRHPGPRQLQGSKPGLLDPTQPARILRHPNSTLCFAAFDPLAASGHAHPRKRTDADPARPKRIVIETTPGNRMPSRWRFVPRARRAPGTPGSEDEGVWPRLVIVCGEPFILSEDQWDIYKLDPVYDCFIPAAPHHSIITRKEPSLQDASHTRGDSTAEHAKKRRLSSPAPDSEEHRNLNKKFRTVVSLVTDDEGTDIEEATESDDEDEVEDIVIEELPRKDPSSSDRAKQRRKAREEQTRERREKVKAKAGSSFGSNRSRTPEIVDLTMEDITPPESTTTNGVPAGSTKRKVFGGQDSPEETSSRGRTYQPNKRARTLSPGTARADMERKRAERERRRMAQQQERINGMKEQREQQFWKGVFADTPLPTPPPSQHNDDSQRTAEDTRLNDEDAERQAAIEESRRKLAELEKDRPLWEQEARKRAMQEQMEEEARRLRKEEEQLRAAEAAAQERQRQRAEAAAAEAQRRAQSEQARVQQEREQRRRKERARWSYGPWTTGRAIERYKVLSDEFDATKFSVDNPADFEMIPWPVLHSPVTLRLEDIEWSAVEAFFDAAKKHMRTQDYKVFVEKSHKRFHPDRWRARGILKSVSDEELRNCLEVTANTVAQALTPIWRAMKG